MCVNVNDLCSVCYSVRSDMDVPTSALIGAHGYCTQVFTLCLKFYSDALFCLSVVLIKSFILLFMFHKELVNLLLCGRAVSNVFDDEMKLDSGNGNFTLLKGIKSRCNIGLLSLFEHYNICKVAML